jgi:hypothetical protein
VTLADRLRGSPAALPGPPTVPATAAATVQDAVDPRVRAELGDQRQEAGLRRVGRQPMIGRVDAALARVLGLGLHVHRRRRIVADQHHREADGDAARRQRLGARPHLVLHQRRDQLAIEDAGAHDAAADPEPDDPDEPDDPEEPDDDAPEEPDDPEEPDPDPPWWPRMSAAVAGHSSARSCLDAAPCLQL